MYKPAFLPVNWDSRIKTVSKAALIATKLKPPPEKKLSNSRYPTKQSPGGAKVSKSKSHLKVQKKHRPDFLQKAISVTSEQLQKKPHKQKTAECSLADIRMIKKHCTK